LLLPEDHLPSSQIINVLGFIHLAYMKLVAAYYFVALEHKVCLFDG
jgi:hypothetical protein